VVRENDCLLAPLFALEPGGKLGDDNCLIGLYH